MLALVTAAAARGLDPDLEPLLQAFDDLDVPVEAADWDDAAVDWGRFEAVILRSTWDYVDRFDEFVVWLDRIAPHTRVVNHRQAIDWNIDKHYLSELAGAGVPIVPTTFVDVGDPDPELDPQQAVWVVKPTIGAGSKGAKRCLPHEVGPHVAVLHGLGRDVMVQPYLELLDTESETSLVFVNDGTGLRYDHAFSKAAILVAADVEQPGALFAKEEIGPRDATDDQLALATSLLGSAPLAALGPLAYARIDMAPTVAGPVLMELELIEPSLCFSVSDDSANRAARAWKRLLWGAPAAEASA